MDSPDHTNTGSLSSEPQTPTPCAHPRPRSATMIPYVPVEIDGKTSTRVPIPVSRPLSPFPDMLPEEELLMELEKESPNIGVLSLPTRTVSPFPSHPFITDADSLQLAVSENPDRIFEAIQNLVKGRDALRADLVRTSTELQSVTDDLANTRVDHTAARHRYEELFRVASSKQVILWNYIESLHRQLAVARGQPAANVGAGYGLGLHMGERGGPGMGVSMEKWISEGMDGDRGLSVGEEGSEHDTEQGTEHSFVSADDSVGTRSLDPNAQAFVPQSGSLQKFRGRSPGRLFKNRSPDRYSRQIPWTPTKHTSYAVQDPFQDQQRGQRTLQPMKLPAIPLHLVPPPHSLIAPLPPRWYGICPHSLAQTGPCPLGLKCQFVPVCPSHNNPDGDGCALFNMGGASACRFVHEYRFCEDVLADGQGSCPWECNTLGRHPATMEQVKMKKQIHMRVRVHKSRCDVAEWDARVVLLSMREAHARGLFNGQQPVGGHK
ncbi:hypothetical protein IFR05_004230 [Cadophora sp. M221]|nr:hypothetical protein IFR05_004230 [Cadophora sp. M221]